MLCFVYILYAGPKNDVECEVDVFARSLVASLFIYFLIPIPVPYGTGASGRPRLGGGWAASGAAK